MNDTFIVQVLKAEHNRGSEEFFYKKNVTCLFLGEDSIFNEVKAEIAPADEIHD